MRDKFEFSGTFNDSILNINSTLKNTRQTINNLAKATQEDKDVLLQLVEQLKKELEEKTPVGEAPKAHAVVEKVDDLMEEVNKPKLDQEVVELKSNRLKKAADNLTAVIPGVVGIATQIIAQVAKLATH